MTESEWLECTDPEKMLEFLRGEASIRNLRLFVCACWRRVLSVLDQQSAIALHATEQLADQEVPTKGEPAELAVDANEVTDRFAWSAVFAPDGSSVDGGQIHELERSTQSRLLRDILGNPFRSVSINPDWLTPTVLSLAQTAYEERNLPSGELDNDRLFALADALQNAGCTNPDILGHLRSVGPHVRGCWVIDLLLGKH